MLRLDRVIHDLWYKNAVIYCLNVETYIDSNGDGVGDFVGLTDKLAYLAGLGYATFLFNYLVVNIWLVGFHSYAGVH